MMIYSSIAAIIIHSCFVFKTTLIQSQSQSQSQSQVCENGEWTAWYDEDDPSNGGDFELISDLETNLRIIICKQTPIDIECQSVINNITFDDYTFDSDISNVYCDVNIGFYCQNTPQAQCPDFKVRFCCGDDTGTVYMYIFNRLPFNH